MKPDLYWIPGPWKGRLAVAPRPRGGDWLIDEIESWKAESINVIVSLLEPSETNEFELQDEKEIAGRSGIRFINFFVPDRDVPSSYQEFIRLAEQVFQTLSTGENAVIHCRQGIGRSGMLAAVVFMMAGDTVEKAIQQISRIRGVPIPETEKQLEWLNRIAPMIHGDDRIRLRA